MSILVSLTTILLFSGFAVSQHYPTYPSCNVSAYDWTYNTLSQSPCELTAWMLNTCQGGYNLPVLQVEEVYVGPSDKNNHNPTDACFCNTVAYSLLCACGACQDHLWVSWQYWSTNCSIIPPPSTFPNPIPAPILIPHWAIIDVTLDTIWNPVTAKSAGDSPEIGPGALIGASSFSTGATGSATPSYGGGSSNTRAIVGGAVGAITALVLAMVILGTLYLRLRRRQHRNSGAGSGMGEDATIVSPSMPGPPLTSTSISNPTDSISGTSRPEMQESPLAADVSSHVVSGPYRGAGMSPLTQPSSESPPEYSELPTVPA